VARARLLVCQTYESIHQQNRLWSYIFISGHTDDMSHQIHLSMIDVLIPHQKDDHCSQSQ
jgi:hypothetical protein